jgi:membrane dipeptidase
LALIVDAHEDIASSVLSYGRDYSKSAQAIRAREAGGPIEQVAGTAMLGLPNWLEGGVAVIFGTLFVAPERWRTDPLEKTYSTPNEAHVLARQQIDIYQRLVDEQPQFKLILTRSDLETVLKTWDGFDPAPEEIKGNDPRQIGVVMLMENADPIRTPEEVEMWYERGLRLIGPAWAATRYCGGTNEPGPLTDDGVRLLKAMNNLNLILDTSHMDERAFFQALDRYDGPVIASHANPRALTDDVNRHLSDDMLKALIAKEGVIGTVIYNKFLLRGWEKGDPKDAANISHVVRAIDYVCQKAGDARHAAIGSDFDGGFGAQSTPAGFDTVADLKIIGPTLKERGYAPADIDLILGGNWLRVLRNSLPT